MLDIQKLTILLVEDNHGDALLIRHLLKKIKSLEVDLLVATCLHDAFAYLRHSAQVDIAHSKIDLILLDLVLPDSLEDQTFSRIKEKSASIPIIVLSGIKDEDMSLQAIKDGAQDYLLKGEIESKLLKKAIWYAIERNNLINERLLVTQELRAHEALLKLITRISTTFINLSSEQIDESISQALGMVGSFLEADRAFIVEMDHKGALHHSYEWVIPEMAHAVGANIPLVVSDKAASFLFPEEAPVTTVPLALGLHNYHWVMEDMQKSGVFSLNTLDELPKEDYEFREALQANQIQSLLLVAIYYEKKLAALLGLASREPFKLWNEDTISLVNPSGEIFYRAIKKKHAEEAIKESEKKYRTLIENMNEGLVHMDADGKVQFINDRVCQMLGYSPEELMDKDAINPLLFDEAQRLFLVRKLRTRPGNGLLNQYELPMRTKNNEIVWMLVNGHAVLNGHGKKAGSMATLVDITDRKKTEEKLQRVNQELKTFIYRASHDLRGPLASVLGLTNLAQMQIQDEDALKFFDYIRASVFKLDKTLKALTDVANITNSEDDFSEIEFKPLITEVLTSMLENSKLDIEVKTKVQVDQAIKFMSGLQPLKYVFENLFDNSIKYHSLYRPLLITVKVVVHEKYAEIEVADNGMGIAGALQSRVFDMFFRGNENSKGSGLGLYVVEKLLGSLKGQIKMESKEGVGSRFFIHLKNMM
ncbi:MAG: PAS domain S-box protein [Bacteroidota bacterium]